MSAGLALALTIAAALLAWALVAACRSYETAAERVSEGARQRLIARHPHGSFDGTTERRA